MMTFKINLFFVAGLTRVLLLKEWALISTTFVVILPFFKNLTIKNARNPNSSVILMALSSKIICFRKTVMYCNIYTGRSTLFTFSLCF